jgi:hypothetical protein
VSSSERFTRNAIVDGITIGILAIAMYTMYSIFGDKANSSTKILSSSSSNDDTVFYINEYSNIPTNSATCVALMTAIILRISLEALQLFQRPHTQSEAESGAFKIAYSLDAPHIWHQMLQTNSFLHSFWTMQLWFCSP